MVGTALARRNVWELGNPWADDILWYARGVAAMMERPLDDPLSWRFFAAMHGFDPVKWQGFGYFDPQQDSLPSQSVQKDFWKQCWHGSWYFLPWHRGYLIAFEAAVRAEVIALGGPREWTLPYWNYFAMGEQAIPPAFASASWPDGANNPLFVSARFGRNGDGVVVIPLDDPIPDLDINLDALDNPLFSVSADGGAIGFGGSDTGSFHHRAPHGELESNPHDLIHVLIGGLDTPGLMSNPATAGLDPIFWLHHANIDRLWETWRRRTPPVHSDPTDNSWLDGPTATGGPAFTLPLPPAEDGQPPQTWTFTPEQMSDLAALGYGYDNYTDGIAVRSPARMNVLLAIQDNGQDGEPTMSQPRTPGSAELIGATQEPMSVVGGEATASVQLDSEARRTVTPSVLPMDAPTRPDRVYLNLENLTAAHDGPILRVYVGDPNGDEQVAGSVALFGAAPDSEMGDTPDNDGMTAVLDITDIVENLHLADDDLHALTVRVVPVNQLDAASDVQIGRIGIYRQSH
ncbi:tyrosinase family protein [Gordonia sp. NPDC003585]|uniref:tyrosinase family protein n=1 Tax=Gordonia sp. NPDC003585 TaxID=3154275 RepID=UPI0033B83542